MQFPLKQSDKCFYLKNSAARTPLSWAGYIHATGNVENKYCFHKCSQSLSKVWRRPWQFSSTVHLDQHSYITVFAVKNFYQYNYYNFRDTQHTQTLTNPHKNYCQHIWNNGTSRVLLTLHPITKVHVSGNWSHLGSCMLPAPVVRVKK